MFDCGSGVRRALFFLPSLEEGCEEMPENSLLGCKECEAGCGAGGGYPRNV